MIGLNCGIHTSSNSLTPDRQTLKHYTIFINSDFSLVLLKTLTKAEPPHAKFTISSLAQPYNSHVKPCQKLMCGSPHIASRPSELFFAASVLFTRISGFVPSRYKMSKGYGQGWQRYRPAGYFKFALGINMDLGAYDPSRAADKSSQKRNVVRRIWTDIRLGSSGAVLIHLLYPFQLHQLYRR
jgi:hypothetical protein